MKWIFFIGILSLCSCKHPKEEEMKLSQKKEIQAPPTPSENILKMERENGVRYVWIEVNGIPLRFIFDTGASSICISLVEAKLLYKQGTLKEEDFLETEYMQDATGEISEGMRINLKTVKIGNKMLNNVKALIVNTDNAPLLLGQSALEQFGSIEIDNKNDAIILK